MSRLITLSLILVLAVFALAACAPAQSNSTEAPVVNTPLAPTNTPVPVAPTQPPATPEPTVLPQPTALPEPTLQTYRNDAIGFEFDYPAGWSMESVGDGIDMLWSEQPTGPGVGGVPENIAKIDIVTEPDNTLTLEELVARQTEEMTPQQIKSKQDITLPSGLPAVRLEVSSMGDSVSLLTVIAGHPVMIINYGDTSHFDDIANTVRPLQ